VSLIIRTLVWSSLFIAFVIVFIPAQIVARSGLTSPVSLGAAQYAGSILVVVGAGIAIWCIATFAVIGRGTPAPFDPPRRLVSRGPYAYVRNPMYIGAGVAMLGSALFYHSRAIALYTLVLWGVVHAFVLFYEEPTLRASFGDEYADYMKRVRRWLPGTFRA
jgi:protein-S-isoprenylcysteine O-methyltransferase Ste14